ncbi:MAG: heme-binding protein [Gammaproteobacteria bacterium]|nr:heme-binding protein [Gammaproteobacteria bacterium]
MKKLLQTLAICGSLALISSPALADDNNDNNSRPCRNLPNFNELQSALADALSLNSTGLNNDMWATIVDRDGVVCAVARSDDRGDQWPGSRVISAQKANTANAFSLPLGAGGISGLALSTANLYSAVQSGGSLFGLQHSNPVDTTVAYRGNPKKYGTKNDPMVGGKIGGVNVFGGGLALYDEDGKLLGGLGVSGDTSCRDHIIAWIARDDLELDFVPAGVNPPGNDNMILDTAVDPATGHTVSPSGFGHPACSLDGGASEAAIVDLPTDFPIGP